MSQWKKVKLKDICLSISDGDHLPPPKTDHGIPFITISNIDSLNHLDFSSTLFVSQEYYDTVDDKRKAKPGDILYSVVGSFGKPVLIKENKPFAFQRHIAILRPDNDIVDSAFMYYAMMTYDFYMQADSVALGAAQRTISLGSLRDMTVEVPSKEVQQHIANTLSQYDTLIENYQQQIKLLEEAAQRLYKEWFVGLHFPGYENTKIVNGVPEGWEKETLGNIVPILTGKKDANFADVKGKYPFFTCAQDILNAPSYSFDGSAVLLAGNGDFNIKLYRGKFEAYQRTYVLIPKELKYLFLIYNAIATNLDRLSSSAAGSTIKFLTKGMISSIPILIPSALVLKEYNCLSEEIQNKIELLRLQLRLLTEARDRLLPKLMSGEIEV